jgi:hypothetical protein
LKELTGQIFIRLGGPRAIVSSRAASVYRAETTGAIRAPFLRDPSLFMRCAGTPFESEPLKRLAGTGDWSSGKSIRRRARPQPFSRLRPLAGEATGDSPPDDGARWLNSRARSRQSPSRLS